MNVGDPNDTIKSQVVVEGVGYAHSSVRCLKLSNIYLNLLDKAVTRIKGIFSHYGIKIILYADDFILMGKKINGEVESYLKKLLIRMGLSLNTSKTLKVNTKENSIDFLGYKELCLHLSTLLCLSHSLKKEGYYSDNFFKYRSISSSLPRLNFFFKRYLIM
jgi:hypothetical protein